MHISWNLFVFCFGGSNRPKQRRCSNQNRINYVISHSGSHQLLYGGGVLKWWYPQIIYFNRVFHYKPSILGFSPYFWKHPYSFVKNPAYFILYFYTVPSLCRINQNARLWHPMALAKAFWKVPKKTRHQEWPQQQGWISQWKNTLESLKKQNSTGT